MSSRDLKTVRSNVCLVKNELTAIDLDIVTGIKCCCKNHNVVIVRNLEIPLFRLFCKVVQIVCRRNQG